MAENIQEATEKKNKEMKTNANPSDKKVEVKKETKPSVKITESKTQQNNKSHQVTANNLPVSSPTSSPSSTIPSVSNTQPQSITSPSTTPQQSTQSASQTQASQTKETKDKKEKEKPRPKKEEAFAKGLSLHASKKHCMYLCSFIKNKSIDVAIADLDKVIKRKKAVPFKGEIPHRSEPGIMSGRYPIKAAGFFITILKGLKGNVAANGLDLDKTRIYFASANWASRPAKAGGGRSKRAQILLKAKEIISTPVKETKK